MYVEGGDVFVLLLACFAPQFLVLLRRCLQGLSHDSREVKCLTPFSWLACSSNICLFKITVCCVSSFLLVPNWCFVSLQRSFTLIIEAWDWDNDTKAGEYLCKNGSFHLLCAVGADWEGGKWYAVAIGCLS